MTKLVSTLFAFIILAAAATTSVASVPGRVTFSARLINAGTPFQGPVQVTVQLYRVATGGSGVWSETHAAMAVDGLVSIGMGDQDPLDATVLDGGALFLEVTVDSTVMSPRLPIGSVPYAMVAERADTAATLGTLAEGDVQRRVTGACPAGSSVSAIDAAGLVTCEADDDTTYMFGGGLAQSGASVSVDPAMFQRRVGACPAGSSINAIGVDGAPTCVPDTNTTYTAGSGVLIDANNRISPDFAVVQRRVSGTCPVGQSIRVINADGSVSCELDTDNNTTYSQSCPAGQFVRALSSGGTATCATALPAPELLSAITINGVQATDTTVQARTLCALTHVQTNSEDHECSVVPNANGTWTLTANGDNALAVTVTCRARCI